MKKGFTMIELLVVIVIIGILIGIALPNFQKAVIKAKEARVKAGVQKIGTSLAAFAQGNSGWYPGVAWDPSATWSFPMVQNGLDREGYTHYAQDLGPEASAGVLGGSVDCMQDPQKCGGAVGPMFSNDVWRWDRLVLEGAIDEYPENPFLGSVSRKRRMFNIFSVSVRRDAGTAGADFVGTCLSNRDETNWYHSQYYNSQSFDGSLDGRAEIGVPGTICDPEAAADTNTWESDPGLYPAGDFAYIPFNPVSAPLDYDGDGLMDTGDYMGFVQGYWVIGYGDRSSWRKEVYNLSDIRTNGGVRFPAPLGRLSAADTSTYQLGNTEYECRALRAIFGAITIVGSSHTEQTEPEGVTAAAIPGC